MIPQHAEIRKAVTSTRISGGEHEYTIWGIKALLDAGAVDILQPDPTWCGGITELTRICALASAHAVPVVPHFGWVATAHVIQSPPQTTCPLQEWLIQPGAKSQALHRHKLGPVNGELAVPDTPGRGIALDEDVITSRE